MFSKADATALQCVDLWHACVAQRSHVESKKFTSQMLFLFSRMPYKYAITLSLYRLIVQHAAVRIRDGYIYYIRLRKTNHVAFVASLLDGVECRNEERDAPATRALFLMFFRLFLFVAMDL